MISNKFLNEIRLNGKKAVLRVHIFLKHIGLVECFRLLSPVLNRLAEVTWNNWDMTFQQPLQLLKRFITPLCQG